MAKTYESSELAKRVFYLTMMGIAAQISIIYLLIF
jgi:hypothetical protein